MTKLFSLALAVSLFLGVSSGSSYGENYYLYTPKSIASEDKKVEKGDGVVVKEIEIQHGDTLSALSHRYSGKASYYPQILLFNDIKNPNLIYSGETLKVPLYGDRKSDTTSLNQRASKSKKKKKTSKLSSNELTLSDLQTLDSKVEHKKRGTKIGKKIATVKKREALEDRSIISDIKPVVPPVVRKIEPEAQKESVNEQPVAMQSSSSDGSQKSFEKAMKAFRNDDYQSALQLFEEFLANYPNSALAADASLYKAECYLKQSGI